MGLTMPVFYRVDYTIKRSVNNGKSKSGIHCHCQACAMHALVRACVQTDCVNLEVDVLTIRKYSFVLEINEYLDYKVYMLWDGEAGLDLIADSKDWKTKSNRFYRACTQDLYCDVCQWLVDVSFRWDTTLTLKRKLNAFAYWVLAAYGGFKENDLKWISYYFIEY